MLNIYMNTGSDIIYQSDNEAKIGKLIELIELYGENYCRIEVDVSYPIVNGQVITGQIRILTTLYILEENCIQ